MVGANGLEPSTSRFGAAESIIGATDFKGERFYNPVYGFRE